LISEETAEVGWDYGVLASTVYDLDKPIGSSFGDVEYYREQLAGTEGPILEPGVGTGRILIPLLEAGFDIDGFDVSADMLALCRRHCDERGLAPKLHEADMTSFASPGEYGAAIVPTGSIVLLDGRSPTLAALRRFYESLRPGGHLILDVPAPRLVNELQPLRHWRRGDAVWTLQDLGVEFDRAANQTIRWLRYDRWDDGNLAATELQVFRLQQWSLSEFTTLLAEAGFEDISVTADYTAASPDPGSDDWTFHATRPG
jgi:SAM-dependent methyltransferase